MTFHLAVTHYLEYFFFNISVIYTSRKHDSNGSLYYFFNVGHGLLSHGNNIQRKLSTQLRGPLGLGCGHLALNVFSKFIGFFAGCSWLKILFVYFL